MDAITSRRHPTPEPARPAWFSLLLGLSLGFVGMHLFVARPLTREFAAVRREVRTLERNLELLSGLRDQSTAALDAASAWSERREEIEGAWRAVESFEKLHAALADQTRRAEVSLAALERVALVQDRLARLKDGVLRQSAGLVAAERVLDRGRGAIADLEDHARGLSEARDRVKGLAAIADEIGRQSWGGPQARRALDELVLLKNDLVRSSHDIEFARRRADSLVEMAARLRGDQAQIGSAVENLGRLEALRDRLAGDGQRIVDAIEAHEVLSRFQEDFIDRSRRLERLTPTLVQLTVLSKSVGELIEALRPAAELHDLRRLDDAELRRAARSILDAQGVAPKALMPAGGEESE